MRKKWYCFEIKKGSGESLYLGKVRMDGEELDYWLKEFDYSVSGDNLVTINAELASQQGRRTGPYQPKTGRICGCKPGIGRDNCPTCEGTGWQVDFEAIRRAATGMV